MRDKDLQGSGTARAVIIPISTAGEAAPAAARPVPAPSEEPDRPSGWRRLLFPRGRGTPAHQPPHQALHRFAPASGSARPVPIAADGPRWLGEAETGPAWERELVVSSHRPERSWTPSAELPADPDETAAEAGAERAALDGDDRLGWADPGAADPLAPSGSDDEPPPDIATLLAAVGHGPLLVAPPEPVIEEPTVTALAAEDCAVATPEPLPAPFPEPPPGPADESWQIDPAVLPAVAAPAGEAAAPLAPWADRPAMIGADGWLALVEQEYLGDFVAAGGGAMRFLVADSEGLEHLSAGLQARAARRGFEVVPVDLAAVRLHLLQNVVFAVASALPWDRLLQNRLEALVDAAGYHWPEPGRPVWLAALADANGVAQHLLRRDLIQALSRDVWQDAHLTQDFRNAMIALLETRLSGEGEGLAQAVMAWLTGGLKSVAEVRQAQIGRRICRQNARAVLMSLCRWVRSCGGAGITLVLDIRRLHRERRTVTEGLSYSPAAVMDCYEVLRQLIDDAEHFPGLFVAVMADQAFLSEDPRRSLGQYIALKMRIWDDVRPQDGDNPLAPLVRIGS